MNDMLYLLTMDIGSSIFYANSLYIVWTPEVGFTL